MIAYKAALRPIAAPGATNTVLGVPIHPLRMEQVVALAADAIQRRRLMRIGVVNAAKIANMQRDALLRDSVLDTEVIVADGMSVVWASRLLGRPLPERVAGIDLMLELLARGGPLHWRVFLLGATNDVVHAVEALIRAKYPGVEVVGSRDGYFTPAEEAGVVEEIQQRRTDVLLVAMSSPKKEIFMGRWARRLGVPVCHGVGGSFDVLAGRVKRAPRLWQAFGMEWLYRLMQEPRRLWKRYLTTNSRFLWMLTRELFKRSETPAAAAQPVVRGR